jgi:hypothetical protein
MMNANLEAETLAGCRRTPDVTTQDVFRGCLAPSYGVFARGGAFQTAGLQPLELRDVLEEVADDLATVGQWRLDDWNDPEASAEGNYYTSRYPGG